MATIWIWIKHRFKLYSTRANMYSLSEICPSCAGSGERDIKKGLPLDYGHKNGFEMKTNDSTNDSSQRPFLIAIESPSLLTTQRYTRTYESSKEAEFMRRADTKRACVCARVSMSRMVQECVCVVWLCAMVFPILVGALLFFPLIQRLRAEFIIPSHFFFG